MPRILRIINRLNLGGPTYNAALLTKHLAPEFETLLLAGVKQDSEESSDFIVKNLGIQFTELPEMQREINFSQDRKAYLRIRQIIKEFKPDIVHTHAAKPGTLGRLAAMHEKVPAIVHTFHGHVFHSYFGKLKTQLFINVERYLARHSTAIVAISNKQKEELSSTYRICPSEKIRVIPLGFDLNKFQEDIPKKRKTFRDKYLINDDEIAVGIIGRLVPIKNHKFFLEATKKILLTTSKKLRFIIVGDGEERENLFEICRNLGLDYSYSIQETRKAQVTFTSWMKDVDIAVAGMDIIALTSFNEGTPVSLIEAQAGNKPIVSTRVGGIEDVVLEGITAFLSPNNDLASFTEKLSALIEDSALRMRMGENGWIYVKDKFHYSRLMTDMKSLYNQLLDK